MYIGKERYCHSSVVARISMYGERIRYIIETELRQQRDFQVYRDNKKRYCHSNVAAQILSV